MQTATAADLIARARFATDGETPSPSEDFITDTEALTYLTNAYRTLFELIVASGGEDLLLLSATLTFPYTLPTNFYRAAGVDVQLSSTQWRTLHRFNFAERNRRWQGDATFPLWRIIQGSLRFEPPTAQPATIRLWYVPDLNPLTTTIDVLSSFGGWDDFLLYDMAVQMLMKEERDPSIQQGRRNEAASRIRTACRNLAVIDGETASKTEVFAAECEDALLFAYDI